MKMKYWLPSILWMGVIFYLSSRTGGQLHSFFPFIQNFNWGHLLAYFILGMLVYFALYKTTKVKYIAFGALLICVFYGMSDEFHQAFVPTRTPDVFDLMNDTIGSILGIFLIRWRTNNKHK